MAIEEALEAERMHMKTLNEQQRILELELEQARYEATLAERRHAVCDLENRLIAAQLEKTWKARCAVSSNARCDLVHVHRLRTA